MKSVKKVTDFCAINYLVLEEKNMMFKKKKSREESYEEIMEQVRKYKAGELTYKISREGENPEAQRRAQRHLDKLEKRYKFFDTVRDIILTPFTWIFGIFALVFKLAMFAGVITFLWGGYKIYLEISAGNGFLVGLKAEWQYLILPFAASFLYFIFDWIHNYCSEHSIFLG